MIWKKIFTVKLKSKEYRGPYSIHIQNKEKFTLPLILLGWGGGGGVEPYDAKFTEKCPCAHNNNTDFIKQISLFILP